jgi:hypothetical protein
VDSARGFEPEGAENTGTKRLTVAKRLGRSLQLRKIAA